MKLFKILTVSLAVFSFVACKNENINNGPQKELTSVKISIQESSRATETGSTAENKITALEFYVFDGTTGEIPATGVSYHKIDSYTKITTLQVESGSKRFVVVANANIGALSAGDTFSTLQAKLSSAEFTANSTDGWNATAIPTIGFEMSGENTTTVVANTTNEITVFLNRLVSKINEPVFTAPSTTVNGDVEIDMPSVDIDELWGAGASETITNADMTFTYEGYAVVNGIAKSDILFKSSTSSSTAFSTTPWSMWSTAGKTYLISDFATTGYYYYNYTCDGDATPTATSGFLAAKAATPVFVYENAPTTITTTAGSGYDPAKIYSLIIKGTIKENVSNETTVRYWRINLMQDVTWLCHIRRNAVYKTTIDALKSCGYATPEEAEKKNPIIPIPGETYIDVRVEINPWEVILYSTPM